MKGAATIENGRDRYRLIGNTGLRKPSLGEVTEESDVALIHSQERRLERWTGHFNEHFS